MTRVEVVGSYLGSQRRNKRKVIRNLGRRRDRQTKKQPVFGILHRDGIVWAEVVNKVEVTTLQPLISQTVSPGSVIYSGTWKAYTGIASKDHVRYLVERDT